MIRMIFSTVRAPQEPALTVESLAMRHTGRPSMRARPVTTPSAGRPSASALAYRPSSMNEPSSTSSAIRSRAKSLPLAALAAWYFSAPPASTRLRSWASASSSSDTLTLPPSTPERSLGYRIPRSGDTQEGPRPGRALGLRGCVWGAGAGRAEQAQRVVRHVDRDGDQQIDLVPAEDTEVPAGPGRGRARAHGRVAGRRVGRLVGLPGGLRGLRVVLLRGGQAAGRGAGQVRHRAGRGVGRGVG